MVAVDKDVKTQVAVTDDATRMSSKMQVAITDDFEFDDYDMSDSSGVVSDNTFETIKHLFFTKKKIPIMITANFNYKKFNSSRRLDDSYKRTISRLFELTSPKFKINK